MERNERHNNCLHMWNAVCNCCPRSVPLGLLLNLSLVSSTCLSYYELMPQRCVQRANYMAKLSFHFERARLEWGVELGSDSGSTTLMVVCSSKPHCTTQLPHVRDAAVGVGIKKEYFNGGNMIDLFALLAKLMMHNTYIWVNGCVCIKIIKNVLD